jgi:hypothetical protein
MFSALPEDLIYEILKYNTFYYLFLVNKQINNQLLQLKDNYIKKHKCNIISVQYDDDCYKIRYLDNWYNINIYDNFYFQLSPHNNILFICTPKYIYYYIYHNIIYHLSLINKLDEYNDLIQLVKDQTACRELTAFHSLLKCDFDIVNAILDIY